MQDNYTGKPLKQRPSLEFEEYGGDLDKHSDKGPLGFWPDMYGEALRRVVEHNEPIWSAQGAMSSREKRANNKITATGNRPPAPLRKICINSSTLLRL